MSIDERRLLKAIGQRHGCSANFVRTETIEAALHNRSDWDGSVAVFSVDHSKSDTCYAWSMPFDASGLPWNTEGSTPEVLFAVLKRLPIDSAADAWRFVSDAAANLTEHELEIAPVKGA